jgi:hypothetical protein
MAASRIAENIAARALLPFDGQQRRHPRMLLARAVRPVDDRVGVHRNYRGDDWRIRNVVSRLGIQAFFSGLRGRRHTANVLSNSRHSAEVSCHESCSCDVGSICDMVNPCNIVGGDTNTQYGASKLFHSCVLSVRVCIHTLLQSNPPYGRGVEVCSM